MRGFVCAVQIIALSGESTGKHHAMYAACHSSYEHSLALARALEIQKQSWDRARLRCRAGIIVISVPGMVTATQRTRGRNQTSASRCPAALVHGQMA